MYFFTREAYFTTVAVSIAVSALSIWILFSRISHSFKITILLTSLLISSKAFIDYCTSGLENPATFLFLALAISLLQKTSDEAWFKINLLAALASLNRLDAILFFLPLLVIMFLEYTGGKQRALKESLLAFLPLFGWFVFSLVYYGSLLPNSAYAKLNHGIPLSAILEMGMDYVVDSFMVDPLTLCVISLTIMAAFIWGRKRQKAVAMGVLLYVLYIIWVGGDFMSGRFFAAPFFLSLTLIAGNSFEVMPSFILHKLPMLSGIVLVIALFAVSPPLLTRLDYPSIPATPFVYRTYEGISDEKAYYWPRKGLQRVVVNKLFRSLESQPLNDSEISKVADARIK
jgi:arabinofuranosyltransferase